MLDEYTDEFGTNLENRIPELNLQPSAQDYIPPPADIYQPRQASAPISGPQVTQYQPEIRYQPPPPPPQPVYQQRVNQPQQQPAYQPPIYQQYVYQPPPAAPPPPPQTSAPAPRQPVAQDRINSVFAEESQELNNLLKAEDNSGCLKNLLFILICCLVVVGSFGLSYLVGAKLINQQNVVPSFSVTKGMKKFKHLMNSTDIVKEEKSFTTYTAPVTRNLIIPPEVQYTAPPPYTPPPPTIPRPPAHTYTPPKSTAQTGTMYRVVVGNYQTKQEATDVAANVRADGFPVYMYQADGKYRLQIGAFKSKTRATALLKRASEYGYNAYISIK